MEKSGNIYTIDEVNFGGCCKKKFMLRAVTNKYDDEKDEDHPDNREGYENWTINLMTYVCIVEHYKNVPGLDGVVCYQPKDDCDSDEAGMNGNWLVKVKWSCCRGRNRVNPGGQDCRRENDRML
jgi:hypothetical protein